MVYQLEILDPEVKALLDSLVKLKLIRLQSFDVNADEFWNLLEQLRSQGAELEISEDDINREVETVRSARYAQTTQGHH